MSTQSPAVAALTAPWMVLKYSVPAGILAGGSPWRTMFTWAVAALAAAPNAITASATAAVRQALTRLLRRRSRYRRVDDILSSPLLECGPPPSAGECTPSYTSGPGTAGGSRWCLGSTPPTILAMTGGDQGVRDASERDGEACAGIYAPYVTDTAISFEIDPPSPAEMAERIETAARTHAWVVLESEGRVVGYAYGGRLNARAAYRFSCEVSVYVER